MTVQANASGVVTGKFTIPANIPAGSKRVQFTGSSGSRGDAVFVGSGTVTTEVRRMATTETTTRFWQNIDPLAQTFTINETCQIAAVDLWFAEKGATDVLVQIRETSNGFPTQDVLAERRLNPADINTTTHTRATFREPVQLVANTEYAIVALCDDAVSALRVAELGKWDAANRRLVTSQPYQVGVLLSSSNASTWTAHQDRDMAFRLHKAVFTQTERTVALGSVAVTGATDLMVLANDDLPSSVTRIEFTLGLPGGQTITVSNGQPVRLDSPVTGNVSVSAKLYGAASGSPILFPGTQLVIGTVGTTGTYVSRAIPAGSNVRLKAIFDALIPAGAAVNVSYKGTDPGDNWVTMPFVGSTPVDDGFYEITHEITGVTETSVQLRLQLTGTTAARPRVRNLRFMTI